MPQDQQTQPQSARQAVPIDEFDNVEGIPIGSLSNVTAPTLLIVGRQDYVGPLAASLDLENTLPAASLFVVEDAGHAAILQAGLTNAAIVSAFLDQDAVEAGGALSA